MERPLIGELVDTYYARSSPDIWLSHPPTTKWNDDQSSREWLYFGFGVLIAVLAFGGFTFVVVRDFRKLSKQDFFEATVLAVRKADQPGWVEVDYRFEYLGKTYLATNKVLPGHRSPYRPGKKEFFVFESHDDMMVRLIRNSDVSTDLAQVILKPPSEE